MANDAGNARTRVLIVVNRKCDPRGTGDAKVAYHVKRGLTSAGFAVSEKLVVRDGRWRTLFNTVCALSSRQPLQIGATMSHRLKEDLRSLCDSGKVDVIVAIHARSAVHVPITFRPMSMAFIIDSYERSYRTYRGKVPAAVGAIYRLEAALMGRYERSLSSEFARVGVLSSQDAQHLQRHARRAGSVVRIAYPVDIEYFAETKRRPPEGDPVFGFIGRLNYLPNQDAVRQLVKGVWPELRARWPSSRLRVVGANPSPLLARDLRAAGVELIPDVSDVRPELAKMTALIVPMRMGGGIQTKILESMAAGVPVICTAFANQGIGAAPERHLLSANSPLEYMAQADRLISDPRFRETLISSAKAWVSSRHNPGLFDDELVSICREIASEHGHGPRDGLPGPRGSAI